MRGRSRPYALNGLMNMMCPKDLQNAPNQPTPGAATTSDTVTASLLPDDKEKGSLKSTSDSK